MWLRGYSRLKKVGLGNKSVLFLLAGTCKEASRHPDYNHARQNYLKCGVCRVEKAVNSDLLLRKALIRLLHIIFTVTDMVKVGAVVALGFGLLAGIITMRSFLFPDFQHKVVPCSPEEGNEFITLTDDKLSRFQQAIRIQSISYSVHDTNTTALQMMLDHIRENYPKIHSSPHVSRELFNFSSLYIVQGSDTSVKPVLLTGHIDVVPAEVEKWSFSPFSGAVDGGLIFGRGTLDNKNTVFGLLEALEFMLGKGIQPKRTIYIAIGHDEEVMGLYGAAVITEELKRRGVRFAFMMDEGCPVLKEGSFPGYHGPVGLVGTAEKGFATLRLKLEHPGGHASAPPRSGGGIVQLSEAIVKLNNNPISTSFGGGIEVPMFEHAAVSSSWWMRVLSSNLWLFSPLISAIMSIKDSTRAQISTTMAFTQISGGVKDNVLPNSASVTINTRLLPGHTIETVTSHIRKVINDPSFEIEVLYENNPSPISSTSSEGYNVIHHTIKQIFPDAIVIPGILIGGTDSKCKMSLVNKVCLVTGASRGIGRGIALALGSQGATVYITGRTLDLTSGKPGSLSVTAHEVSERGGNAIPVQCDHDSDQQIQLLFDQIERDHGRIDLLVNNAFKGVKTITANTTTPFWEQEMNSWDDVMGVGLRCHFIASQRAAKLMVKAKSGLIVNISSAGALFSFFTAPYGVGKAALDKMSEMCGKESFITQFLDLQIFMQSGTDRYKLTFNNQSELVI
eukprot:sb/3462450/